MSYIEVAPEVKLHVLDWGTGQPIVLSHGWPLSHEMFEYQLTELPKRGFRCVAYDRRGFGKSSKPWEGYDYDTLADDLHHLLESLDLRNVTLLGFSMGGGEAVRYLSKYGNDRVAQLILVGAAAPYLVKTDDNPDGVDPDVFEDDMIAQIKKDRAAFMATFGKQFFGVTLLNKPVSDELMQWFSNLAMAGSPRAFTECVKTFGYTDLRDDVRSITVPTLIIHGSDDKTVPFEASAEKLHQMIPGSRLIAYDGAPHGLFYEFRDRFNDDIAAFAGQQIPHRQVAF
jgi:pimeloyl-ACP methyl ester carboxylesterase